MNSQEKQSVLNCINKNKNYQYPKPMSKIKSQQNEIEIINSVINQAIQLCNKPLSKGTVAGNQAFPWMNFDTVKFFAVSMSFITW